MIEGILESGAGCASKVSNKIQAERCEAAGMPLKRGTINVRVQNLQAALEKLGAPVTETQQDAELGPLRWWSVYIIWSKRRFNGFVVRHQHTRTNYLELMSDTDFKEQGADKGDFVEIVPRSAG